MSTEKVYEFVIEERRRYVLVAGGSNYTEAKEDAMLRFHRLAKSGEALAHEITKPVISEYERIK